MKCLSVCLLFSVALLYTTSLCRAAAVVECDAESGSFVSIQLMGCVDNDADICEVKRGTNSSAVFRFKSSKPTTTLTATGAGVIGKLEQPVPLQYTNLCDDPDGGLKCPLEPNVENSYMIVVPIPKNIPRVRCDILWQFRNDAGELVMCIRVPIKIIRGDDEQ